MALFCIYFTVTCERLDYRAHVRKVAYYSCRRERCGAACDWEVLRRLHTKHGPPRKRPRVKIPPLTSHDPEMGEAVQPTGDHTSYGGTFHVTEENTLQSWQKDESDSPPGEGSRSRELPPDFRIWEPLGHQDNSCNGNSFGFKVVSYNVLAQYLLECHPYLYTHCSPRDLKWNVRSSRLYDEIISLEPDILCLQEVQVSHLSTFYSKFEELGYTGIFKQKTGHRQDGCAIYFKQALFELQDHMSVEFYQPELPILNRDNIGVMVKLVPRSGAPALVVATTHLLFNPKRTDVRLAQMQVFLAEIDRFAYYSNESECGHFPIILTGDFNSMPESAVIELLDRGQVSTSCRMRDDSDWERIGVMDTCQHLAVYLNRQHGRPTDFTNVKIFNSDYSASSNEAAGSGEASEHFREYFNGGLIGHQLRLASVYDKYKPDGHCEASTYQDYWVTVDYIYFSCGSNLRLTSRLRLPSAAECEALGTLPNEFFASDHLALAATFQLQPTKCSL